MSLFETKKSSIFENAAWLGSMSDPSVGMPFCRDDYLELMAS